MWMALHNKATTTPTAISPGQIQPSTSQTLSHKINKTFQAEITQDTIKQN